MSLTQWVPGESFSPQLYKEAEWEGVNIKPEEKNDRLVVALGVNLKQRFTCVCVVLTSE